MAGKQAKKEELIETPKPNSSIWNLEHLFGFTYVREAIVATEDELKEHLYNVAAHGKLVFNKDQEKGKFYPSHTLQHTAVIEVKK